MDHKKYTIGCKDDVEITVSNVGAMIHEFRDCKKNTDIFYPFRVRSDGKERGGCPICFPFFGPPVDFYPQIPQHGWLRRTRISTVRDTSHTQSFGALQEQGDEGGFFYVVKHMVHSRAVESRLSIVYPTAACGQKRKPLNLLPAFHPYYLFVKFAKVHIGNRCYESFLHKAMCVPFDPRERIVIETDGFTLCVKCNGFERKSSVYLWSDSAEYFCVEPVCGVREKFVEGEGMNIYAGNSRDISMIIEIID